MTKGTGTPHYATLDALRGVAAIAVLLLHSRGFFWDNLARSAYLAVDFFFILSGFVVAHAYEGRLRGGGMSVAEFTLLRWVRLYPLHLAGLAMGTAVAVLHGGEADLAPAAIAVSLLFGALFMPTPPPYTPYTLFPLNAPAWSLFFEVVVNIAYGIFARRLSDALLILAIVGSGALLCLQAAVAGTTDSGATWSNIHGGFARVFFSFSLGVLMCRHRARIPAALGRVGPWPLLAVLFALFMVRTEVGTVWRQAFDLAFIFAIGPFFLAVGMRATPSRRAEGAFAFLGAISFPLYVLHFPLIAPAEALAMASGLPLPVMGALYLAASIGLAALAVPVDAAARRRLLGRLSRKARERPASAP